MRERGTQDSHGQGGNTQHNPHAHRVRHHHHQQQQRQQQQQQQQRILSGFQDSPLTFTDDDDDDDDNVEGPDAYGRVSPRSCSQSNLHGMELDEEEEERYDSATSDEDNLEDVPLSPPPELSPPSQRLEASLQPTAREEALQVDSSSNRNNHNNSESGRGRGHDTHSSSQRNTAQRSGCSSKPPKLRDRSARLDPSSPKPKRSLASTSTRHRRYKVRSLCQSLRMRAVLVCASLHPCSAVLKRLRHSTFG